MNPVCHSGARRPDRRWPAGLRAALVLGWMCGAAAPATAACVGDCDGNGAVPINELIKGVNVALGATPLDVCAAFDRNGDGEVRVDELLAGVNSANAGCPIDVTPSPTPTATPSPGVQETRCAVPAGTAVNFDPAQPFCDLLSSYRFFRGDGSTQAPNDGVLPYDLNTPLFSDYASKHRFVWMPAGVSATYKTNDSFELPVGAVFIKTFAYAARQTDGLVAERLIETRLLVRRAAGWEAITYLWNDTQTEARRRIIGARVPVTFIEAGGGERTVDYHVPNTNQCKECHEEHDGVMGVLGPKARNLNKDYAYDDGTENQLVRWAAVGYLSGAPDPATAPRNAVFDDPESGTLEQRARSYLDVNCGNCHNPSGLARTSGLYLDIGESTPFRYGICKPPVAAGQGSGGRRVDIFPGQPDDSILVYRMESTKPGEAMPELGRQTTHVEALAVIREWIESLPGTCELPD